MNVIFNQLQFGHTDRYNDPNFTLFYYNIITKRNKGGVLSNFYCISLVQSCQTLDDEIRDGGSSCWIDVWRKER